MVRTAELQIAVFDHSVDEMRETIRSTLKAFSGGVGFGPMAERFRTTSGHALYATTVADSLEAKVKALGFTILPSRLYEEARFKKYFPDERVDQVRNWIGDLHEHLEARIRDAMSVATVARLKGEKRTAESVFYAGTIFVTRNSVLARRVLKALSVGRSEPDPRFTIATDGQLAGVLWFVSGITGVELSRKRLIANCSSAVLPKQEVVSRIARMLSGLNDELSEEFSALMKDRRASLCPMRLTSGIVDSIDEEKSLQILQAMKDELVAPVMERVEAAEARAAESEAELARAAIAEKETVLILQDAIQEKEGHREADQVVFNEQIQQLEYELGSARKSIAESEQESQARLEKISNKVASAEAALREREDNARYLIYVLLWIFAIAASLTSILVPKFDSHSLRVILAIVYLASVRWVSAAFDRLARKLVFKMFASDRKYIAGLKEGGHS